jgi:hypothetical protein
VAQVLHYYSSWGPQGKRTALTKAAGTNPTAVSNAIASNAVSNPNAVSNAVSNSTAYA